MKTLIVATSRKPRDFTEQLKAGKRSRIEFLELSDQLPASYMDYDAPWMHGHKWVRGIEERIHLDFYWAAQIAKKVKRENFDLVLSMSERVAVPLGMVLDPRVKHVAILMNAMAAKWLLVIKLLHLHRRWSHIVTFSQAEADTLRKELSISNDKITRIPNWVDLDFFNPGCMEAAAGLPPFILSQGLSKRDYPTLIRAMRKLPHVTCRISAVSAWDTFKPDYEGMDIPRNVQLNSLDYQYLIKNITAQSRFVVIPLRPDTSMWTAGSTSVLEAQAMGKPVIVTHLPGIAEYVRDGETGYLVKGNDPDAMAAAIDRLWQDPARAAEMGRAARNWVSENFSLQSYVDRISALLIRTCETAKAPDQLRSMDIKTKPRRLEMERN